MLMTKDAWSMGGVILNHPTYLGSIVEVQLVDQVNVLTYSMSDV